MTELTEEQQKLSSDPVVEMFDFDATGLGGGIYRFYSGAPSDATLVWRGNLYVPIPVMAEGWEQTGKGSLPTPIFKISNVAGKPTSGSWMVRSMQTLISTSRKKSIRLSARSTRMLTWSNLS